MARCLCFCCVTWTALAVVLRPSGCVTSSGVFLGNGFFLCDFTASCLYGNRLQCTICGAVYPNQVSYHGQELYCNTHYVGKHTSYCHRILQCFLKILCCALYLAVFSHKVSVFTTYCCISNCCEGVFRPTGVCPPVQLLPLNDLTLFYLS